MLGRTNALLDESIRFKSTSQVRPKILHQLGVNCRWSPILIDEQPEAKEVAYAGAYLDEDPSVVFAGDRAPDAPVIVGGTDGANETTLFKIFGPTKHTVLIFPASELEAQSLSDVLRKYPAGTIISVAVLPKEFATSPAADMVVIDRDGHARKAYPPVAHGFHVIVVRPDGVVGAVVQGAEGVQRYFDGIFGSI